MTDVLSNKYCSGFYCNSTGKLRRDVPPNKSHTSGIFLLQHTGLGQVHSFMNIDFQGLQGEFSCDKGVCGRVPATKHSFPC